MKKRLPQAKQQRCITHKVRGIKRHLCYDHLSEGSSEQDSISLSEGSSEQDSISLSEGSSEQDSISLSEGSSEQDSISLSEGSSEQDSISFSDLKQQRCFEIQSDAYDIYTAPNYQEAQTKLSLFVEKWQPIEPKAVSAFARDIELTLNFYEFDPALHPRIRTSNLLERLFEEFRRKSDEVGAFPNEQSCLTLFFLVVQRDHAKHNRSMG